MSVRKAHNTGRNHLRNVVDYYQRTSLGYREMVEMLTLGQRLVTKKRNPSSTPLHRRMRPKDRAVQIRCWLTIWAVQDTPFRRRRLASRLVGLLVLDTDCRLIM